MLFASTGGAIYGDQGDKTVFSETDPTYPVYAIGKLTIENYLRYFRRKHGLNSTVLRLSNPYGPRQNPNKRQGIIPIFLRQLALGRPVTVFGDGTMVRDYIYVADLAEMVAATVGRDPDQSLYNVGSGTGYSILEILDAVRAVRRASIPRSRAVPSRARSSTTSSSTPPGSARSSATSRAAALSTAWPSPGLRCRPSTRRRRAPGAAAAHRRAARCAGAADEV